MHNARKMEWNNKKCKERLEQKTNTKAVYDARTPAASLLSNFFSCKNACCHARK